ncbi:MAG: 16S rRNA (adenine(1518)-N(6)/adenine(1519)-N(6))-dimethyltransferase RsmA [Alphaproteobacteria bacterium]
MNEKLLNLPPVAEMMRDAGLEPKKQFGQNFLFDLNLTRKIARNVPNIDNQTVIEVGPGPGGLTRALLECGADKVIAIEKDKTTQPILSKIADASDNRLEIIYADAMKINVEKLGVKKYSICSNLPYNVGTELLIQWLHLIAKTDGPASMTLMFQREVAQRIIAKPGDKQYGRLSVLVSLVANAKILFNVPNTAFFPAPKVQSAVVQMIPKDSKISLENIERLTAKLFGQRRKMLRGIMPGVVWARFGLVGTERAEELSPEKFVEIAHEVVI